jgi:hypothetical protein
MAISPAGLSDPSASILRLSAKGRAVFTPAGWNTAVRNAGQQAIGFWLATIAHKRFNWHYAQRELPYRPGRAKTSRHFRYKEDAFTSTGQLRNNLMMRSSVDVRAKRGGLTSMRLRVPIGHWMRAETLAAFRFVPVKERMAVAREFRKALIMQLQTQRAKAAAKAQATAAKQARAAANKAKREASRQRRADRKILTMGARNTRRARALNRRQATGTKSTSNIKVA